MPRDVESLSGRPAPRQAALDSGAAVQPRAPDHDAYLADLAAEIRQEHAAVRTSARQTLDHAIRAGELLLQAKDKVGHGRWTDWLPNHCDLSERTAQAYMRLARNKVNPQLSADLTIDAALKALAEPKPGEAADIPDAAQGAADRREAEVQTDLEDFTGPPPHPVEPKPPGKPTLWLPTHAGELVAYPQPQGKATFNRTNDQVSWAGWTWNPITGCLHGCKYC
jgi:hypothetical protein